MLMAMSGFICHDDYLKKTSRLSDEELGRVFRALMTYHETGVEPDLGTVESMAFDFIRVDIDRAEKEYKEKCDRNRDIRLTAIENERKRSSTDVNERDQEKKRKEKEKEKEKTTFIDVDDAQEIQHEHDRILDAAKDAGFKLTNNEMAALISLYADHGEKVLDGIRACSEYGVPTLAYLRACMTDRPKDQKEKKPSKVVVAQEYTQRDYSDEDADAFRRMLARGTG